MDDTWQVGGLPLHPLLVHAVVVLIPLAVAAVGLSQFWPEARRRLGVLTPLSALAMALLVPVTIRAGEQLKEVVGPLPRVEQHEDYGRLVLPWTIALAVLAGVQWWWFRFGAVRVGEARVGRAGQARAGQSQARVTRAVWWALSVATAVIGVGALVAVVLAGDSGARAVWEGVLG